MDIKIENHTNAGRINLFGGVTIYSVCRLKEKLLEVVHGAASLEIDLADVNEWSTSNGTDQAGNGSLG